MSALEICEWLVEQGLNSSDYKALAGGYCERLVAQGVPLSRFSLGSDLLDPVMDSQGIRWTAKDGLIQEQFERDDDDEDIAWQKSPFKFVLDHRLPEYHWKLDDTLDAERFPMLGRFKNEGARAYVAMMIPYEPASSLGQFPGIASSFLTERETGFSPADLDLLRQTIRPLAHVYKTLLSVHTCRILMRTYLGADAGRRVSEGAIERGRFETIEAVLWVSDLAHFTRISDTAPSGVMIDLLNGYADTIVTAVGDHGGEVLKFIGDGIVAIFPLAADAPARALEAAVAAKKGLDAIEAERKAAGLPASGLYIGLHVGEALYGNIGSRERLDFTVIGPSVNETSRISGMCRSLDQWLLVSQSFEEAAGSRRQDLVSLGRYALRGVGRPQHLFTLDPETLGP